MGPERQLVIIVRSSETIEKGVKLVTIKRSGNLLHGEAEADLHLRYDVDERRTLIFKNGSIPGQP